MIGSSERAAERRVRLADDPAQLELMPAAMVRAEAAAAGLAAQMGKLEQAGARLLIQARALREHGRRAGAAESLAKAARVVESAIDHARTPSVAAAARLERLRITLDAAELGDDGALLDAARARFADLAATPAADALEAASRQGVRARIEARLALAAGSADRAVVAGEAADAAVAALARIARQAPMLTAEWIEARLVRADLLTGFALRLRDASLAERAAADMAALAPTLDADRTPLLAARAATRLGAALTVQGELTGDAGLLTRAVKTLAHAFHDLPHGHSPADRAALGRALGQAAQALAEITDESPADLYEAADRAFAAAAADVSDWGASPLAAAIAFERAMALARRGDASGDVRARAAAEIALRAQLLRLDARRDPAAWAAAQVALARLYGAARRPEATLALSAAVEVFRDQGLKSLAETAAEDLDRLAADAS